MRKSTVLSRLKNGVIVSCQRRPGSAGDRSQFVAAMAAVAEEQGAVAVGIRGMRDIHAVRRRVHIPVLGIEKINDPDSEIYFTPPLESVRRVQRSAAHIITLDTTELARPRAQSLPEIVGAAKANFDSLLMADVATPRRVVEAARQGDKDAQKILGDAAHDLARVAQAVIALVFARAADSARRAAEVKFLVCYSGGAFQSNFLLSSFSDFVCENDPRAEVRPALLLPVLSSLLLAYRAAGVQLPREAIGGWAKTAA